MSHLEKGRRYGLIFVGIGLVCLLIAVVFAAYTSSFLRTAIRTSGVIIEMRERLDRDDNSRTYAPVFRFKDQSGAEHIVESRSSSNPPQHRVGDSVVILFQSNNPERARIDGFMSHWGGTVIAAPLGIIFVGLGGAIWRRRILKPGLDSPAPAA